MQWIKLYSGERAEYFPMFQVSSIAILKVEKGCRIEIHGKEFRRKVASSKAADIVSYELESFLGSKDSVWIPVGQPIAPKKRKED